MANKHMEHFREAHPGYWTNYNRANLKRRRKQWREYYLRHRAELLEKKRTAYRARCGETMAKEA